MTAKIWISIIAGVAIAVTSAMGMVYSLWFFPLIVVGVCLTALGLASLGELRSFRGSRDYSRPKIFRSPRVNSLLAGTGYSVVVCSSPSMVKLALFEGRFPAIPVDDGHGRNIWTSFYLPEVNGEFSDVVARRLYGCVEKMRAEALAAEQQESKSRAFETWVELSRRGK